MIAPLASAADGPERVHSVDGTLEASGRLGTERVASPRAHPPPDPPQ